MKEGTIVKYADGWYSPGEEVYRFVIFEAHPDVDRYYIGCINSRLTLGSSERVSAEMITPVGPDDWAYAYSKEA